MKAEGAALVTGAGRGLGLAVALALADAGFDVIAGVRSPDTVVVDHPRVTVRRLDVREPDTIEVPAGLRVLVNNAGIDGAYLPVEHAPMAQWREVMETNCFGAVEVTRRAIPALRGAGGGVVVNITSASLVVDMPLYGVYRASKAALAAMGESLRAEVAQFGIRVVEVLPGPIDTDMLALSDRQPEAAAHEVRRARAGGVGRAPGRRLHDHARRGRRGADRGGDPRRLGDRPRGLRPARRSAHR